MGTLSDKNILPNPIIRFIFQISIILCLIHFDNLLINDVRLEFLNNRFDPFDLKLDGWSEQINENIAIITNHSKRHPRAQTQFADRETGKSPGSINTINQGG